MLKGKCARVFGLVVLTGITVSQGWSQATIQVTPIPVDGGSPTQNSGVQSAQFHVASSTGAAGVSVTLSADSPWLAFATSDCGSSSASVTVTTPADPLACVDTGLTTLNLGYNVALITLSSSNQAYAQIRVPFTINVFPTGEIKTSPSAAPLSSTNLQVPLTVAFQNNNNDGTTSAKVQSVVVDPASPPEGPWLTAPTDCVNAQLIEGVNCSITAVANPARITAGVVGQTYYSKIGVTSATGDRADIAVSFNLTQLVAPPTITLGPSFSGVAGHAVSIPLTATGGQPPYTWTVAGLSDGLTFSSGASAITGVPQKAATISAQVSVRDSAGVQATPQSITISIQPAATTVSQLFPHVADGTEWQMEFLLINPTSSQVTVELKFHLDNASVITIGNTSTNDIPNIVLAPNASVVFESAGLATSPLITGWAELISPTPITGVALFRRHPVQDGKYYEGSVPLSVPITNFTVPLDGTSFIDGNQFTTGIGIANTDSSQSAQVTCSVIDENGNALASNFLFLNIQPSGHTQSLLQSADPIKTVLPAGRGLLTCHSSTPVGVLGLRFLGGLATSSIPVF